MIPRTTLKRYVRHALIRMGMEGISLARAGRLWRSTGGRGIIFTLHHVRPQVPELSRQNALLTVTPAFLDDAIQTCLEYGLTPLPLEELPARLADPRDGRAYVCFTLDDGYRDNAQFAAPIFHKHGIPYTIFVASGFVERTRSMWWETVEALLSRTRSVEFDFGHGMRRFLTNTAMQKVIIFDRFAEYVQTHNEDEAVARIDAVARDRGIDPIGLTEELTLDARALERLQQDPLVRMGAHSVTHVNLRRVNSERLRQELVESADAVERYVGYRPRAFAYPYGFAPAVGEREMAAAVEAGFAIAVTNKPGLLDAGCATRPTNLKRVSLNGSYQRKRYVGALISGIPFKLIRATGPDVY